MHKTHSFSYLLICIKLNVPRIDTKIIIWIPTYNVYNWWWMPIVDPFWTSCMLILALELTIESLLKFACVNSSRLSPVKSSFLVAYNHHSIGSKPSFWQFFGSMWNLWKIIGSNSNSFVICWIKFHFFNDFLWRTSHFAMLFQGTGTRFACPRTLPWHCLCERLQPLRNWAKNANAVSTVWR